MINISRSVVLVLAVVVAALVAFETTGLGAANPGVADQVAQRFPLTGEMFTPVPVTSYVAPKFIAAQKAVAAQKAITEQTARPTRDQFCASTPNGWPYMSEKCRVTAGGSPVPTFMRS